MDFFGVFDISSAGMSVEQSRLAVAAANLANSRTSAGVDGTPYQPLRAVVQATSYQSVEASLAAESLPRPMLRSVEPTQAEPRLVYDPGHPDANAQGFVSLPGVDPLATMMDLISVSRSYEANLRAFDITRSLLQRTIEMGNPR